jgi:hypothetical protein
MREFLQQLAARHGLSTAALFEAWAERAAIRQHLAGFSPRAAELFAVGDVEQMYAIGLHCSESLQRWVKGGQRSTSVRTGAP